MDFKDPEGIHFDSREVPDIVDRAAELEEQAPKWCKYVSLSALPPY
jgi:hypothetical protein